MRVVCGVEGESYVRHSAAMLHSLLSQHPTTLVRVEYLHGDDTGARGRRRLSAMVGELGGEITFHRVSDRWVEGLPVKGFTRKATWYRIFLDELLPDLDRVLWLDIDLLVMDSLQPLWMMSLEGSVLGAVTNVPLPSHRSYTAQPELGDDLYFNAGVLLMDLERIRHDGIGQELRSFSVRHAARLHWRDQDALNLVLHDRRLSLHPRWNCMNSVMQFPWASDYFSAQALDDARRRPAIRHFEGPAFAKPWHLLAEPPMRSLYRQHRRQTPWPRVWPRGCTPSNLLLYGRRRVSNRLV